MLAPLVWSLVVLALLAVSYAIQRNNKPTEWQYVSNVGAPKLVFLSNKENVFDLKDVSKNPFVYYDSYLAEFISKEVTDAYEIIPQRTRNWEKDKPELFVFVLQDDGIVNFAMEAASREFNNLHFVGYSGLLDTDDFLERQVHFRRASVDAHRVIKLYPGLDVQPELFLYETLRARLSLMARSDVDQEPLRRLVEKSALADEEKVSPLGGHVVLPADSSVHRGAPHLDAFAPRANPLAVVRQRSVAAEGAVGGQTP